MRLFCYKINVFENLKLEVLRFFIYLFFLILPLINITFLFCCPQRAWRHLCRDPADGAWLRVVSNQSAQSYANKVAVCGVARRTEPLVRTLVSRLRFSVSQRLSWLDKRRESTLVHADVSSSWLKGGYLTLFFFFWWGVRIRRREELGDEIQSKCKAQVELWERSFYSVWWSQDLKYFVCVLLVGWL